MKRGDCLGPAALTLVLGAVSASAAAAQPTPAAPPAAPADEQDRPAVYVDEEGSIVVTVRAPRGTVIGNVPPELVLDADDIRATGASDIGELVEILRPQLGGPPTGEPIVLLNGRRVADRRAISIYPREAIERTEILPPHVALSYGYPAESRVINIVLRQSYRGGVGEAAAGFASEGGRDSEDANLTFVTIAGDNRLSLNARFARDSGLLESERGIVQPAATFDLLGNVTGVAPGEIDPALSAIAGRPFSIAGVPIAAVNGPATIGDFAARADAPNSTDIGRFRTLLPAASRLDLSAELNRLVGVLTLGVSARYGRSVSESLLGLASASLRVPAGNPFSPFGEEVLLHRYFDPSDPLARRTTSDSAQISVTLSGTLSGWNWQNVSSLDHSRNVARTDTGFDLAATQSRIDAGDPGLNPFGDLVGESGLGVSRLSATRLSNILTVNGTLLTLPAGPIRAVVFAGYDVRYTERELERSASTTSDETSRRNLNGRALLHLPVASRRRGVLPWLGELSLVLNAAVQSQTGSPALLAIGYGANWQANSAIYFSLMAMRSEQPLSDEQLNAPVVETPNVRLFDFQAGETAEVVQVTGGNPSLLAPRTSNVRLMALARISQQPSVTASATYLNLRIENLPGSLTVPTPELEAAFPDRFVRDAGGRLVRFDSRPVNFARSERSTISGELSVSLPLAARAQAPRPGPRPDPASRPSGAEGEAGPITLAGSRLLGTLGFEYGLRDDVLIRDGLPAIDLFESAYGGGSGRSRASFNYLVGLWHNGVQARLQGISTSGRTVRSAQSVLDYSALTILNAQLSFDFGSRPEWVRRSPFFNGFTVRLDIRNLLNDRLRVRDQAGETPLSLQPAYLDALGRSVRLSLRKTF